MNKLFVGSALVCIALIGIVGTAWLSAFISDNYAMACFIQGCVFLVVGAVGAFVVMESQI